MARKKKPGRPKGSGKKKRGRKKKDKRHTNAGNPAFKLGPAVKTIAHHVDKLDGKIGVIDERVNQIDQQVFGKRRAREAKHAAHEAALAAKYN
jgi:hypothetical protein